MKKLLIQLRIVQVVSNDQRHSKGLKRLGDGFSEAQRLNPFNPLSYLLFIPTIFILLLLKGIVVAIEESVSFFRWT